VRRRLARAWLTDARAEHASVTAFERLAADLTMAGAPAELVTWAQRAAVEEVGHATMCFAVASAYAERELRAAPLRLPPASEQDRGSRPELLHRLARDSLIDGCIAEGAAASMADEGASRAVDPAVRGVLARIAREEASHEALAYEIVGWAIRKRPSLLPTLYAALEKAHSEGVRCNAADDLQCHGRLSPARASEHVAAARSKAFALIAKGGDAQGA
jgi:hypothetical protein